MAPKDKSEERSRLGPWLGEAGRGPKGAEGPWRFVRRAARLWREGDRDGALADVERFIALKPQAAAGYALRAMLRPEDGGEENMEKALARSREGWVYALRASLRSRAGDMAGARRDIDQAVKTEKGPWALLERASILNRTGAYEEALREAEKVRRALPGSPEPLQLAADIHLDQAQYRRAEESLGRLIRLRPREPLFYRKRARVHLVQGRLAAAQADLERTRRLKPQDQYLAQDIIHLLILQDRFAGAERALTQEPMTPEAREFWRAYLRCRQRRYAEAREGFAAAVRLQQPGDLLREKAEFFGSVARVLEDAPAPRPARRKELIVVGLGYNHPFQVTVGALRAIASAEVLYSNLSDPKVSDFLGLFPIRMEPIVFRGTEEQADASAVTVMEGFRRARRTAIVTRGVPVVYGRLAWKVYEGCRRDRIKYTVPGAISIFDEFPCLVGLPWPKAPGMQVLEPPRLDSRLKGLPIVLYSPKAVSGDESRARRIPRVYPPDKVCFILPGGGEDEFKPVSVSFRDLPAAVERANPACILYIP